MLILTKVLYEIASKRLGNFLKGKNIAVDHLTDLYVIKTQFASFLSGS